MPRPWQGVLGKGALPMRMKHFPLSTSQTSPHYRCRGSHPELCTNLQNTDKDHMYITHRSHLTKVMITEQLYSDINHKASCTSTKHLCSHSVPVLIAQTAVC